MKQMLIVMMFLVFAMPAFAVEGEAPAPQAADELSGYVYSYGSVVRVSAAEVVVLEYDYDNDAEKETVYLVDQATKLEGLNAITDLKVDDIIEIYYLEVDGKKVAKMIHREVEDEEMITSPEDAV